MGTGYLAIFCALLVGTLVALAARAIAARLAGVRGFRPVLAFDQKPWANVARGRRLLFTCSGPLGAYLASALVTATGYVMAGETTIDESSMRVLVQPSSPAMATSRSSEATRSFTSARRQARRAKSE